MWSRLTDSSGKAKASGWPSLGEGDARLRAQPGDGGYEVTGSLSWAQMLCQKLPESSAVEPPNQTTAASCGSPGASLPPLGPQDFL